MILLANFLNALALVINLFLQIYFWILLARVIISWINADPYNPIVRFIASATDPLLYYLRRKFPFLTQGGIDFAPMAVLALIYFLQYFLVQSISDYAMQLKLSV